MADLIAGSFIDFGVVRTKMPKFRRWRPGLVRERLKEAARAGVHIW
jgi:hypothetical protein